MPTRRHALPQPAPKRFLDEGGIGTTRIFREGLERPHFATFTALARLSRSATPAPAVTGHAGRRGNRPIPSPATSIHPAICRREHAHA